GLRISRRDTIMYALIIVSIQLVLAWFYPDLKGYSGWLFFGFLIGRFIGVHHPPSEVEKPLDGKRKVLGWLSLGIFIESFSPAPLTNNTIEMESAITGTKELS